MKRIIAVIITIAFLVTGCSIGGKNQESKTKTTTTTSISEKLKFSDMKNPESLEQYKDEVYSTLINSFGNKEYYIEDIKATYVSQEYIDEINENSKENIYFGYTLSQLDKQFSGKRYVFTSDDNGKTVVKEFEKYDDTYEQVIKNVSIGAGVILFCATVSAITGGATSIIFATAASEGTKMALSAGGISTVISGGVTYVQTGDMNKSLKSAILEGSKEFKWGAILGSVVGGFKGKSLAKEPNKYDATKKGFAFKEDCQIQKKSKYSPEVIKYIGSEKEYEVYKNAGNFEQVVNGKKALIQKIDLQYKSKYKGEMITNYERIKKYGLAPLDNTGASYEIHHMGQESNSTYAILTKDQHQKNTAILHPNRNNSKVKHGYEWEKARKEFWKSYAEIFE